MAIVEDFVRYLQRRSEGKLFFMEQSVCTSIGKNHPPTGHLGHVVEKPPLDWFSVPNLSGRLQAGTPHRDRHDRNAALGGTLPERPATRGVSLRRWRVFFSPPKRSDFQPTPGTAVDNTWGKQNEDIGQKWSAFQENARTMSMFVEMYWAWNTCFKKQETPVQG